MRKVSFKRIHLIFLLIIAPLMGYFFAALVISSLFFWVNYPNDAGLLLALASSIFVAYPAIAILIVPCEKWRKKSGGYPLEFYILLMTAAALAGGIALIFSPYEVHPTYLPCFALLGPCYGLAIAMCLPWGKVKQATMKPACEG